MLITFKTLQQKTFKIEIEETEKVKKLKERIAEERGDEFPIEGQKLIYAGKILDDDKSISEYNIDPVKNFVVVMAVKVKPKAVEKPTEASTAVTATQAASSTTADVSASQSTTPSVTTTSTVAASETTPVSTTSTTAPTQPGVGFISGSALESTVTELMSLGFSREQVLRALQASFQNADRAAEYLFSGDIPTVVEESAEVGDDSEAVPAESNSPAAIGDLSFLRNLPQFRLMRSQVQRQPDSLPDLLQEIGRSNPQLLQLITQNQEAFIALLNESEGGADGNAGGEEGGASGGGGFQVQVTTEEKSVIDRIVAMGFSEGDVIQAFFACEKNEQLTINFLLGG